MIANHLPRSYSRMDLNQMELVEELTKLNASLKLELEKCYKYIDTLQRDLHEIENRSNISIISQSSICIGQTLEQQRNKLKEEVAKLTEKVKEKRSLAKSLQKHCEGLQIHLQQALRQKQQLQVSISNLQYLLQCGIRDDKDRISRLERTVSEQRNSIQMYLKQLQGKAVISQKLYARIENLQKLCSSYQRQTEQTKQTNKNLNQKLQEQQRKSHDRQFKVSSDIRQLENKISNLNNQINRLTSSPNSSLLRNSSVSSFDRPKAWPVLKRITIQQRNDVSDLLSRIRVLEKQKDQYKERSEKLKNDIISIKLDHSNALTKNHQLFEEKSNLQKSRNQLIFQLQQGKTIKTVKHTDRSYEANSLHSVKTNCNKTIGSIGSILTKRHLSNPEDGEVPVHDKGSTKGQFVYLSSSFTDPRKGNLSHRQSTINYTSFR